MRRNLVLVIGQLQQGGAEGQMAMLARALVGSDLAPSVACLSEVAEPHATTLREAGVPVEVFPRHGRRDLRRVRALAAYLKERDARIVHSFLVGANAYAYAASRLAGIRALVVSSRTSMTMPRAATRMVHSWIFRHASLAIANAESVRRFTASYYGVDPARIRTVHNGVDLAAFGDGRIPAAGARARLGAGPGDILIGTLGRISKEKNLDLFVDAAAVLSREAPRARFAIIGDGPYRPALEERLRASEARDRILLAGATADVAAALGALDLFVMTSDTEGLPNAVMEAMAAGRPVVSTRVGGVPEVIVEGETGRMVPPGERGPLLEAMRALVSDAGLRARMGAAGRARIEKEFSVERMVAGTRAVYEEVLGGAAARAA